MASCRSSLESDMLTVAMNQAHSGHSWSKNLNTSHVTKDSQWPHRSFRDAVHGVRKWLADVTLSFQALQATPQVAGIYTHFARGHKIRNRLPSTSRHFRPCWAVTPGPWSIAINIGVIEFSSRVENPKENSRSSRQPSTLGLRPAS